MKNTVFILGAGSSASYGFPTGEDLKNLLIHPSASIFKLKKFGQPTFNPGYYLDERGVKKYYYYLDKLYQTHDTINFDVSGESIYLNKKELSHFREEFRRSHTVSIDTFVSHTNDDIVIKAARVLTLLVIRAFNELIDDLKMNDNWIGHFIQRNLDWNNDVLEKLPTVISFNYDRLFYLKIKTNLQITRRNLNFDLNKWQYEHIYGCVEDQDSGPIKNSNLVNYLEDYLGRNFNNIHFIRSSESSDQTVKIQGIINSATDIYILGYGFDRFNNKILFSDNNKFRHLAGKFKGFTGYGLPDSILKSILRPNHPSTYNRLNLIKGFKCYNCLVDSMPVNLFPE